MKLVRLIIAIVLIFSVNLFSINVVYAENLDKCKIPSIDVSAKQSVGWPRSSDTLKSIGEIKFLILPVDFPDANADLTEVGNLYRRLELSNVEIFYNVVSSGLFKPIFDVQERILRMPYPSSDYGQKAEEDSWNGSEFQSHHIVHEALLEFEKINPNIELNDYQAAVVVVTAGKSLAGRAAYALVDAESQLDPMPGDIHNSILVGLGALSLPDVFPGRMLTHEINHLLGIPDLYLYSKDGYWQGKSMGPFGQQGYIRGIPSTDSIAYNRWLRDWVNEDRVVCFSQILLSKQLTLSPRGSTEGQYELALIRTGKYEVLAIESPKESGFGSITFPRTVLVYTVDSSIDIGQGPFRLVPKKDPITTAPLSPDLPDWERYKTAALKSGESVMIRNMVVKNVTAQSKGDKTSVAILIGADAKLKTINCVKGKKVKKIKDYLPSCPIGYTLKNFKKQ